MYREWAMQSGGVLTIHDRYVASGTPSPRLRSTRQPSCRLLPFSLLRRYGYRGDGSSCALAPRRPGY